MKLGFLHQTIFIALLLCQFSICHAGERLEPNDPNRYLNAVQEFADKNSPKHDGVIYRNPRVYNVEYTFEMFPDPNKVDRDKDLKLWVPIPREWDSQRAVKIISVEPEPHGKYVDPEYGNPMLFWDFGKEPEKASYKVQVKFRSEQYDVYSEIDPNRIGSYDKTHKDYVLYTRSTNTVTITDKVRTLSKTAVGDETNPYLQAKLIYDFVREKMCYQDPDLRDKIDSVETILGSPVIDPKTGQEYYKGVCYHHSAVYVALCRAVGIPARNVIAFWNNKPWNLTTPEHGESNTDFRESSIKGLAISGKWGLGGHGWAEIYLPSYGWVPVDPTFGRLGNSNVNNRAVIITKGRDIQIAPEVLKEGNLDYRTLIGPLVDGRCVFLLGGVFHASNIKSIKVETLNHPDPFPADALAEYLAKLYPDAQAEKNLVLYRKRTLRWIDENTREHTDKAEALVQAYKKEPMARYEHEAFICHMLRKIVGDKKFFEIVETYTDLRVKSGEPVSTAHFQKIAEEIYGQPLGWFFKQWIGYTELPHLQLGRVTFSKDVEGWHVRGTLRQLNRSLFRLPVEILIETDGKTEHKMLWIQDKDTDFEFHISDKPKEVLIDPDNDILQIREMPPLLECSSYDEIAYCTITDQDNAGLYGWTPLHFAAQAGQIDIVEYLIAHGDDVNAENIRGETPLQLAAGKDHKEVMELLIEKGADVSLDIVTRLVDLVRVKKLIEEGAEVNAKDTKNRTALHYAAEEGHKKIVELLLAHGADVNAGANYNQTAAEMAMWNNHNEIVQLLISKGADISPLQMAIYLKDEVKAKSLIEGGADVNKRTPYGTTPLDRAINAGLTDIVKLLLDRGAYVNSKDNWDWTPLHSAVYKNKEMVELLLAKGANVNAKDGDNRTPLWYAKQQGHTEIVELLKEYGAKE